MLKRIFLSAFILIICINIGVINTYADDNTSNDIKVFLNGQQLQFDTQPTIIQNRTLVPMRAIFEALGASVDWNESEQVVTAVYNNVYNKSTINISLKIGSNIAIINGQNNTLDVLATIINNRTFVPLRFISEALGYHVYWDEENLEIHINNIGKLIGSDEYFNFYLYNGKIHSIHWNGKEEDNDTFLYNDYLYFESQKGIYRLKTDGTNFELLTENGTGHFSYSRMTIKKVEKGAIFYIRHGYTGDREYRFKIANDPSWVEPTSFGQIDSSDKFCFYDEGTIWLLHIINDNLMSISPFKGEAGDVPISYKGYLYFSYGTHMYRVTPEGTAFEHILDAEGYIKIDKIESGVIYYDEILEGGRDTVKKQMEIK